MSNKTRLQTNNTNLQALIDKANALPDAEGSGGGSIETCEVILSNESPVDGTSLIVYYVDGNQTLQQETFPATMMDDKKTITVQKNSIMITPSGVAGSSDYTSLSGYRLYFVTVSMTLTSI